MQDIYPNNFIIDKQGMIARVIASSKDSLTLQHMDANWFLHREAWGLKPRDTYQAMALNLLLDPDIHLVSLTGSAGSGKTILALAAAIEMTVETKQYRRIVVTRSTQGLDEDIGFLPGTEEEKMEPWLGAITDNLEALHYDDEDTAGSIDYILNKVPLHFKSLNYIRGRSFQHSLILIDESQNLTPHQIKTIVTRAGSGSKVICLGNLTQIDTPYLSATSSGLTYLIERFKGFKYGGNIQLQGVPRSLLAEYAENNL
jgi:PhoH-like ATPase